MKQFNLSVPVIRRRSRIQKGGFVHSEGGGFVQEFQERIQIVAGPWANQQAKKIADSRRGAFPITQKKNLYPRLVIVRTIQVSSIQRHNG